MKEYTYTVRADMGDHFEDHSDKIFANNKTEALVLVENMFPEPDLIVFIH